MTCADRLRDLHAAIPAKDTWSITHLTELHAALPDIAAVIEAAEQYINTLDLVGMADDGPIADALAALSRRLEGGEA